MVTVEVVVDIELIESDLSRGFVERGFIGRGSTKWIGSSSKRGCFIGVSIICRK
jgi:hypothetical protein